MKKRIEKDGKVYVKEYTSHAESCSKCSFRNMKCSDFLSIPDCEPFYYYKLQETKDKETERMEKSFKVGDRVRAVKNALYITEGKVYPVVDLDSVKAPYVINDNGIKSNYFSCTFELVEEKRHIYS